MEKNVCFITASQVDTGTVADEQSVLLSWGVGVFRSSSIQEQAMNKSYDKKKRKLHAFTAKYLHPSPCW